MANEHDGGSAFSRPVGATPMGTYSASQEGMSLRDYFAGQALAGFLASVGGEPAKTHEGYYAKSSDAPLNASFHAYKYADAMLTERARTSPQVEGS